MDQPSGLGLHFFAHLLVLPFGVSVAQPAIGLRRWPSVDLPFSAWHRSGVAVVVRDGSPLAHLGVVASCRYRRSAATCSANWPHLAGRPCARENRIPRRCDQAGASRARKEWASEKLILERQRLIPATCRRSRRAALGIHVAESAVHVVSIEVL